MEFSMKEKLPVNADVLKWGRISLGLSCEEVAQRLGASIKEETVRNRENGKGSPTYSQLEKLAHAIYKHPVVIFFFPSIPEEDTPKSDFRALAEYLDIKVK